ncbi:methylated-DNA--[protein]-cysteine S-methyltransferase [Lentibacillus halophilus]|uniref:Methylated-DNA--protein-cysteine methyltransferase n=1 Tax=Lentibacillus halophilus TaxID=295065 RepID=A0ABN0Z988_9BACI
MALYYDELDSPIGRMIIIADEDKVVRIDYATVSSADSRKAWLGRYFPNVDLIHWPEQVKQAKQELLDYFQGMRQQFSFAFAFYGTPFQKQIWQSLINVAPYGETTAYKAIAEAIGNPKAVRAAGGAISKNPISIVVPCHRIIGSDGKMVGYNGGLDKKNFLLTHEKNCCQ